MRISTIGHAGSGKSVLAQKISERCGIPYIHIDRLWFDAGGHLVDPKDSQTRERTREALHTTVEPLLQQDSWVCDGWQTIHPAIAERADKIIFLDIPLSRRLFNHIQRAFLSTKHHQEIPILQNIQFLYKMIKRTYAQDADLRKFVAEHKHKTVTLRSYAEIDRYLIDLKCSVKSS